MIRALVILSFLVLAPTASRAELRTSPLFWAAVSSTEFNSPVGLHLYDFNTEPISHFTVSAPHTAFLLELWRAAQFERQNEKRMACFSGDPQKLYQQFFAADPDVLMSVSPDQRMIGIEKIMRAEDGKKRFLYLRLHACHMVVANPGDRAIAPEQDGTKRVLQEPIQLANLPETSPQENGYDGPSQSVLEMNFEKAQARKGKIERPWRDVGNIRREAGALAFTGILQKYFYEGMADQNLKDVDDNFIPQKNRVRLWCNMPWENVGPQQRESMHGFMTGRPLAKNRVYPRATAASNWGASFFNEQGCRALYGVFGSSKRRKSTPDWRTFRFPPGTVIVKIHFTESPFLDLEGALKVSAWIHSPYQVTGGGKQQVRHYQMDIAVKDPDLQGAKKENNHWVMMSYYFDSTFANPDPQFAKFLPQLKHMRPMGIQFGFGDKDSIIFAGSKTNSEVGFLTGPADSPRASCLSCHATAGTNVFLVPGITKYSDPLNLHAAKGLDYSLSLQHALNLFYTRPQR